MPDRVRFRLLKKGPFTRLAPRDRVFEISDHLGQLIAIASRRPGAVSRDDSVIS